MKNYLLIGTLCAASLQPLTTLANNQWTLARQKEGVEIFTQVIDGSELKAFKGIIEIDSPKQAVMDIVSDVNRWSEWVPDVVESKIIDRKNNYLIYYVRSDLPWPVRDRDGAYRFDFSFDNATSSAIYKVSAMPEAVPLEKRVIRIPKAEGEWSFTEIKPERTRVSFTMHADPGGALPNWLINASVTDTPLSTLSNLKRYAMATAAQE